MNRTLSLFATFLLCGCFIVHVHGPSKPIPPGVTLGEPIDMGKRTVRLISYTPEAFQALTSSVLHHFADEPLNPEEDKLVLALEVLNNARAYCANWNWRNASIMEWSERQFLIVYDTPSTH